MKRNDIVRKQWNQAAESFSTFVRTGKNYYCDFMKRASFETDDWKRQRKKNA